MGFTYEQEWNIVQNMKDNVEFNVDFLLNDHIILDLKGPSHFVSKARLPQIRDKI